MPKGFQITSNVRLVLITGSPGAGKTGVAKAIFCAQPEDWRILSLDDFFYLSLTQPPGGDNWARFEANAPIRALVMKYIGDRRGRVIAEGIIQSDSEVETYCSAMNLSPGSSQVRFFDLRCPRAVSAERMSERPIKEDAQVGWTIENYARHSDWLTAKLRATGAIRIETGEKSTTRVATELIDLINR